VLNTEALSSLDSPELVRRHHDCLSCHLDSHIHNQERRCGYRTRSFEFSLRMKQSSTILPVGLFFSLVIPSILVFRGYTQIFLRPGASRFV
jgi:hypothetical protein